LEEVFGAERTRGRVAVFRAEVLVREARDTGLGRWRTIGDKASGPAPDAEVSGGKVRRRRKNEAGVWIDRIETSGHRPDQDEAEAGRIVPGRAGEVRVDRRNVPKKNRMSRFPLKPTNRRKTHQGVKGCSSR
jgi:hypothetical protein